MVSCWLVGMTEMSPPHNRHVMTHGPRRSLFCPRDERIATTREMHGTRSTVAGAVQSTHSHRGHRWPTKQTFKDTRSRSYLESIARRTVDLTDAIVDAMVTKAIAAQRKIEDWSEVRIDMLLRALSGVVAEHAQQLAVATVDETGMGNVRDKTIKNSRRQRGHRHTAGRAKSDTAKSAFDRERQVAEIASPAGVVVGLVPATHPVATFIFKVLIALKGRNAIILEPQPAGTGECRNRWAGLIQQASLGATLRARRPGAVDGRLEQSADDRRRLMSHRHVGLVLATGGQAMVQAAYRSGRPGYRRGSGNAPALIAADADCRHAARSVVQSKTFDNGLICGAENHLVVEAGARERLDRRVGAARRRRC